MCAVRLDGADGDRGPGVAVEDHRAGALAEAAAFIGMKIESPHEPIGYGVRVEGRDAAHAFGGDLGEVALVRDHRRHAAGEGFGDRDREAFLAARETEGVSIGESGEFGGAEERSNEMDAVGDAEGSALGLEGGASAIVGTGDDEAGGEATTEDLREGVGEDVEALFVVQAREEQDVRFVGEFGVINSEGAGRRKRRDFAFEHAVGDDDFGRCEPEGIHEPGFVGVEDVEERGVVQERAVRDGEGEFLLETFEHALASEAPGVEHAMGHDGVGDSASACLGGGGEEDAVPHAVEMENVEGREMRVEPCRECAGSDGVPRDTYKAGHGGEGLGRLAAWMMEDRDDGVVERGLSGSESGDDGGGAPLARV